MDNQPLVSIIMPSYNTADFIGESVQSVLDQTYLNWELLIVDDCSTDQTDAVLAEFSDKRIVYQKNDINSGAAVSRNKAIASANGRYIAFLDSDDLWSKEKLEKQVSFMFENDYGFTYTEYELIDGQSQPLHIKLTGPKHISKYGFYLFDWAGCLTVMYDVSKVGLIQIADIKKRNDYAMWLNVNKRQPCHLLQENLAKYRKREGSISNVGIKILIRHHYHMFRTSEKMNVVSSGLFTFVNVLFGAYKKTVYIKINH